jgi:hypothetical protein
MLVSGISVYPDVASVCMQVETSGYDCDIAQPWWAILIKNDVGRYNRFRAAYPETKPFGEALRRGSCRRRTYRADRLFSSDQGEMDIARLSTKPFEFGDIEHSGVVAYKRQPNQEQSRDGTGWSRYDLQ